MNNKYRVNMDIVKKYDSISPYLKLVRRVIKDGEGYVSVYGEPKNGRVEIYAHESYGYLLPCPTVPVHALTQVS